MGAAQSGRLAMVKLLIEKGININAQDDYGWTALMFAAKYGHLDTVKLLIAKGANVNTQNKEGQNSSFNCITKWTFQLL